MAEYQTDFTLLPKVINGGIAGLVGISCTFPLDLVKTRLQKQAAGKDGHRMYNSIFDTFKKIYRAEGLRGMYRGSGVLILLVIPEKAVKLAANDFFRFHLRNTKTNELPPLRQALAGALTGLAQLIITVPMELLKIQLQDAGRIALLAQAGQPPMITTQMSARRIVANLVKSRGILGLYKGTTITMFRDVPFCAVYFSVFAQLDGYGPRKLDGSGDAKFYWSFLSGLMSGSFSALIVTPLDVMKTRIQTVSKTAEGDRTYSSVSSAFLDILKHEGVWGFFKGGACRMIVIAPLYGVVQGVYYLGVAEKLFGTKKNQRSTKRKTVI